MNRAHWIGFGLSGVAVVVGLIGWALRAQAPEATDLTTPSETTSTYDAEILLRLSQVGRIADTGTETETIPMFFDVYIDRTDLGLTEPNNWEGSILTTDLAPEQQVVWMETSDGIVCESNSIPHRCEVPNGGTYTLSVEFADGGTATATVEVPEAPEVIFPELIAPTQTPAQGDPLTFTVQDVGAQSYDLSVNFCRPYDNDGINPCLEGYEFSLDHTEDGAWTFYWPDEGAVVTPNPDQGTFTVTLDNTTVAFESSITYSLCAYTWGLREDDVGTFIAACTFEEFSQ